MKFSRTSHSTGTIGRYSPSSRTADLNITSTARDHSVFLSSLSEALSWSGQGLQGVRSLTLLGAVVFIASPPTQLRAIHRLLLLFHRYAIFCVVAVQVCSVALLTRSMPYMVCMLTLLKKNRIPFSCSAYSRALLPRHAHTFQIPDFISSPLSMVGYHKQ